MKPVSGKRLVEIAQSRGWFFVSQKGSHVKLRNPIDASIVVIPLHGNRDMKPGLQRSLMRQLGLEESDLQ